jgi:XapX domain-containing protein
MARLLVAYVLAFGVGMFCKYFEIPAPAPPVIPGALLVVAMTFGYVVGDRILPKKNMGGGGTTVSATANPSGQAASGKEVQK